MPHIFGTVGRAILPWGPLWGRLLAGFGRPKRRLRRLSQKKKPRLLFIPTASSDSEIYWNRVQDYFGGFLKCKTDVLFLIKEQPSKEHIQRKVSSADIIYVGVSGGAWALTSFSNRPTKMGLGSLALAPVRSVGLIPDIPIPCLSTTRESGNT
jgi:hypothetical protein